MRHGRMLRGLPSVLRVFEGEGEGEGEECAVQC